ncbi:MAG: VCBS repeat-containing protein [Bdellovibrionaceae bacterium]|nr:VCBS repeat-containing protein [Pseudobdellovibrionaceae bacterium]
MTKKFIYWTFLILSAYTLMSCSKVDQLAETRAQEDLTIHTNSLSPGIKGLSYSAQIVASGGTEPYSFTKTTGSFPPSLSLDSSTGILSGVIASTASGQFSFSISVTDTEDTTVEKSYTVTVSTAVSIVNTSLTAAQVNVSYLENISATGGTPPYSYSASGLPSGYSINSTTGAITGISSSSSSSSVDITVTDSAGLTASETYTFYVNTSPAISTTSLITAGLHRSHVDTLIATGGVSPYTFSLQSGTLPTGLSLASDGTISGTTTNASDIKNSPHSLVFKVTDSIGQTATKSLTLSVKTPPTIVSDMDHKLRVAAESKPFLEHIKVRGGVKPLVYGAVGLPSGLSINASSGYISGTPSGGTAGTYSVSFTINDAQGFSTNLNKTVTIVSSGLSTTDFKAPRSTYLGQYNANWSYPNHIKIADMNNDGINDVVYAAERALAVLVMIGNGSGHFTTYAQNTGGYYAYDIRIADFDGDGKNDIISSNYDNGTLTIFKGDNSWTGTNTTQVINLGSAVRDVVTADFNGDSVPDIAVVHRGASTIRILLNCQVSATVSYNGNPTQACSSTGQPIINFHSYAGPALVNGWSLATTDMNANGKADLIATRSDNSLTEVFLGNGQGVFTLQSSTSNGGRGYHLKVADFTGDNIPDAVVANRDQRTFVIMTGDGTGSFSTVTSYSMTSGGWEGYPRFIDVADVDGDGDKDLAISFDSGHMNNVGIFLNAGNGNFSSSKQLSLGYYGMGIALGNLITGATRPSLAVGVGWWVGYSRLEVLPNTNDSNIYISGDAYYPNPPYDAINIYGKVLHGDLNNDGFVDLISKIGGSSSIFFGTGAGTYNLNSTTIPTGDSGAYWIIKDQHALEDFNGDGNLDYVSANYNSAGTGNVSVTLGNGDGTFGGLASFTVNTSGCIGTAGSYSVATGDYNGDGNIDMAVSTGCSVGNGQIYVFAGYGDGTFNTTPTATLSSGGVYTYAVISLDVNQDGYLDLVSANSSAQLYIFKGLGNGTFAAPNITSTSTGGTIGSIQYGEFNGDNIYDFIVSATNTGMVAFMAGGSNGTISSVTTSSGMALYSSTAVYDTAVADVNKDGYLDVLMHKPYIGVQVLLGNGTGTLTSTGVPFAPPSPGAYWQNLIDIYDANNDGLPDIVWGNGDGNGPGLGVTLNNSH